MELRLVELNNEEIELIKGNTSKKALANITILDYNGVQKSFYFDICLVSPTCKSLIDQEIPKVIAKAEKRKNDTYSYRIKEHRGGDFYPFIPTSEEALEPL